MITWLIPLAALIVFEFFADILAKNWSMKGGWLLAVLALLGYLLGNAFWLFALKNGSGLARGAIVFSLASAILALLLGLFLFKEEVTPMQMLGMVMGLMALLFIFWE